MNQVTSPAVTASSVTSLASDLPRQIAVAIGGSGDGEKLVRSAHELAQALGSSWEAVHVETPGEERDPAAAGRIADAMRLAAQLSASIAIVPAATVLDGLSAYLENAPIKHLVLGKRALRRRLFRSRSGLDELAARNDVALHIYPARAVEREIRVPTRLGSSFISARPLSFAYAALAVLLTLVLAEGLQFFINTRSLDLLFLFPVIAIAARWGVGPGLFAAALSVVCYNFFLLAPAFDFDLRAPQNIIMALVLTGVTIYTGMLTHRLRGRLVLSDRSARENASIASLAQRLAADCTWTDTATTLCEYVESLLKVHATVFREIGGELLVAAATPSEPQLGPVDQAALDWAWRNGIESGAGTDILSSANWQFQPLKTSLGMLAILGIARDDGRDPIAPHQRVLFSTLVAQAALAHERLRLEDDMRSRWAD
ncbi:DUF4118 domain-containing protein [Rhizorhabdus dicambivorans]|uniref:DUF4118 domain-containing protein n=1 Tax=Rhizorhabdus dicambivorans TaxID=1850238 RepID=A0A2A4FQK3_9SPHN|nr:DUF4118 domain-containing protein [Rhizorhabdus dicambivorans]ATE64695.1 DUF4118 domain-containing protein [Rhizorhabdus dicambivorans]PCE39992.1 DUF4118 domain-containing protein [Rhizorhabdus dicambivorans]